MTCHGHLTRLTNQALGGVAAAHLVALVDPVDELRVGRRPREADRGRVDGFGLHVTWGDGGNFEGGGRGVKRQV